MFIRATFVPQLLYKKMGPIDLKHFPLYYG